jgi:tetratricopeptide (TPR) repeat protein
MARTDRRNQTWETLADRVEDRLRDAPLGLHQVGDPASPKALARAKLPDEAAVLWRRWDGLGLGNGEARLLSLADSDAITHEANDAGILREGDRVIGEAGRSLLVLPADPWAEGGDVVMVEEDGERAPYASSVIRMVIGMLAEMSILYDDEGEYREGLFDELGVLTSKAERRLLRRRLDFDEDAPFPRFRLGQLLRRGGELRAARSELRKVLHRAPEFAWAHWELGRAELELSQSAGKDRRPPEADAETDAPPARENGRARAGRDDPDRCRANAREAFAAAAEKAGDASLRALFLAWQARASEGAERERLARTVLELDPRFVSTRETAAREALEDEQPERARELLELGLTIEPRHLGLLALRGSIAALPVVVGEPQTS